MKFEEVLPALREGKKIRRKEWQKTHYYIGSRFCDVGYELSLTDLLADDWEIVKEKKKVKLRDLTREQFDKWREENCGEYNIECEGCPFERVFPFCETEEYDWTKNKDLFSDKFLDQEIEIEE